MTNDEPDTLAKMVETYGEAKVLTWALKSYRAWKKSNMKPPKEKKPSVAAFNRWLKSASREDIEELKKTALAVMSGPKT